MPSSNKTAYLALNRWLGTDKPKKDDFNEDNRIVDAACQAADSRLAELEAEQQGAAPVLAQAKQTASGLATHLANTAAHVTPEEKAAWSQGGGMVSGTYTGTGTTTRKVAMGFRPRFGMLYAVGKGIAEVDWNTEEVFVFAGLFGAEGSCQYITPEADGITVNHHYARPMNGSAYKFNESGTVYAYMVWR